MKAAVINQRCFAADALIDCRETLTGIYEKDFRKHKGTLAVLCFELQVENEGANKDIEAHKTCKYI